MNRFKTLLTAGLALAMAFTLSCSGGGGDDNNDNSGGTFTVTGIPAEYNGKYAVLYGLYGNPYQTVWGAQSVDGLNGTVICVPIANGSVSLPVWMEESLVENYFFRYKGQGSIPVVFRIYSSQTYTLGSTSSSLATVQFGTVQFTDGSATKAWTDGEVTSPSGKTVLSSREDFKADGTPNGKVEYEYDSKGNLTKETRSGGLFESIIKYEYDTQGNMTKETTYDYPAGTTLQSKREYVNNTQGNKTKETYYANGTTVYNIIEYEYNAQGNMTKQTYYAADGTTLQSKYEYEYNAQGDPTKTTTYGADGTTVTSEITNVYEYNAQGKKTKQTLTMGTITQVSVFEYDEKGNLTKRTSTSSTSYLNNAVEYEYDAKGNKTKESWYDGNGALESYNVYKYKDL